MNKRGILDFNSLSCGFCFLENENLNHLLGGCRVVVGVWKKIFAWIGNISGMSLEDFISFPFVYEKVKSSIKRNIVGVIWLETIWCIWWCRNAIIFKSKSFSFFECVSENVYLSWEWLRLKFSIATTCNFHTWNILPLSCVEE